jgi:hypothetical protein
LATFYTDKEIAKTLRDLHIKPEEGRVTGAEAARILSWRARQEYQTEYTYDATALRQHVKKGHFPQGSIVHQNARQNLYPVDVVFSLPIAPRRGKSRRQRISEAL